MDRVLQVNDSITHVADIRDRNKYLAGLDVSTTVRTARLMESMMNIGTQPTKRWSARRSTSYGWGFRQLPTNERMRARGHSEPGL